MAYRNVYMTAELAVGYDTSNYSPGEKQRIMNYELWWEAIDKCGISSFTWQEVVKKGYILGNNRRYAGMTRGVYIYESDYQTVLKEYHVLKVQEGDTESEEWLEATEDTIVLPVLVDPKHPELGMESGITPGFDKKGKPLQSVGKMGNIGLIALVFGIIVGAWFLLMGKR